MLEMQCMRPGLKVTFFATNNPYYLIKRMLQEANKDVQDVQLWIDSLKGQKQKENLNKFLEDYQQNENRDFFGSKLEENSLKYEKIVKIYVRKYYGEVYSLAQFLNEKT